MRRLAIFAGAFSAGIFTAHHILPETMLLPASAACLIFALAARLLLRGDRCPVPSGDAGQGSARIFRRRPVAGLGRRLFLIGTALSLALTWDRLYLWRTVSPMEALSGTEQEVVLTLQDRAVPTTWGPRATVRMDGLRGKIAYYGDASLLDLRPGQTVRDTVRFRDARRIRDEEVWSFASDGIFLLAYGRGEAVYGEGTAGSPRWWPVRMGGAVRERIGVLLDGDPAAFLTAMLTGERRGLSVEADADLSEAGLSHVLAVSGLHCGFLYALARILCRDRRRAAAVGIPLLIFFALMTGARPSVVRAAVMLSLYAAAPLVRRESDGPTALSAALMAILIQCPYAARSLGLQLSFGATAGLLWITPGAYRLLMGVFGLDRAPSEDAGTVRGLGGWIGRALAASLAASIGAQSLTAPLCLRDLGSVSLAAPLSGVLCLWAAGAAFVTGTAAVVVSAVWMPLGVVLARAPDALIRLLLDVAHWIARLPGHALSRTDPAAGWWLAGAYLLAIAGALWKGRYGRRRILAVLTVLILSLPAALLAGRVRPHAMDAVVLDVGQGACTVVVSGDRSALVDCGSANSWYDAGALAARRLRSLGHGRLDRLILTHYDSDHVDGLPALCARIRIGEILAPEGEEADRAEVAAVADAYGIPLRIVRERETVRLGEGSLTVFPPVGKSGDNDRGLSALFTVGETDLLITGDMGASAERALIAAYDLPDLEALVAGHHGSRYSTCDDLLAALSPETVCVSVGSNSYGHPAPDTLGRLARHGCTVLRTDEDGDIHLVMGP